MKTATRRQTTWAIGASILAHLVVGVVVMLQHPVAPPPLSTEQGPPEPIIPILIMPRTPPPGGKPAPSEPIRLHRRPQPFATPDVTPAFIAPPSPAPSVAAAKPALTAPPAFHPAPQPEGLKGDVRAALRHGTVGCANPLTVGLNQAERDGCDEKFGKGAKDAAFAGLGLSPDKQKLLEAAGAQKESDYRYKHSQAPGAAPDINRPGESAEQMCAGLGVDPEACKAHSRK